MPKNGATEKTPKRVSYATTLSENLQALVYNRWYSISGKKDYDRFVATIKEWIDVGCPFEFNGDYTRFRIVDQPWTGVPETVYHQLEVMPQGYRKEFFEKGYVEQVQVNGKMFSLPHESGSYRIFKGDKLIAIEHDRNTKRPR